MNKINGVLFVLLVFIVILAASNQLGHFSSLPDPNGTLQDMRSVVLWDIRLPRLFLAILAGAGLAIAGNAMQGIFQNPLASPGLLGSSSGATIASIVVLYYFSISSFFLLLAGILGALFSFLLVYWLSYRHTTAMILLTGVAINVLFGAIITLLLSNAQSPWALSELYLWLQGSFAMARMEMLISALPFILLGVICLYSQRHYLNVLSLGEETVITMGINLKVAFFITCLGVALFVGAIIPQTGVIGFIGLIAPHIARILLRKLPSQLYITSGLIGALLLVCADLALQYISFFQRIHIGTLTALFGAPFLIWIISSQKKRLNND